MSSKLKVDTRVTVETPEGVDFQFLIAGAGKRATAFVTDLLLRYAIYAILVLIAYLLFGATGFSIGTAIGAQHLIVFFVFWLYGASFEAFWNGQTPGKRLQNLRVVRSNGTPIGWYEAFGRNLLIVADGILIIPALQIAGGFETLPTPLGTIGLLTMAANRRMQRLGDLAFDTMVVDESREFITRSPGVTDGVEVIPRSQCSGRFHVPERTLAVIERLFEGDRLVSDSRREEISRPLATALRSRLGYEDLPPDPRNPNSFFVNTPIQNTLFLKRVLRTFSEDPADQAARKRQEEERLSRDPARYEADPELLTEVEEVAQAVAVLPSADVDAVASGSHAASTVESIAAKDADPVSGQSVSPATGVPTDGGGRHES